jgi:hypothetical protein
LKNAPNDPSIFGRMRISVLFALLLSLGLTTSGQEVYHHINNTSVYEFLDEMATLKVIDINTPIRPFSRHFIAKKLNDAYAKRDELSKRQQKELDFYLQDFIKEGAIRGTAKTEHKSDIDFIWKGLKRGDVFPLRKRDKRWDLFYYKDSLFTFSVNPIIGGQGWVNDSALNYHRFYGAEFHGYLSKYVGIYANMRDNQVTRRIAETTHITQRPGAVYKGTNKLLGDFSEMRGGITLNFKWATLGLIKDNFKWGDGYNGSNIFSGRSPSPGQLKLSLRPVKWLSFEYVHAWLASDVLDSTNSYINGSRVREVMRPKYLAANMYTVTPTKRLNISVGNSVVYSDQSPHPSYFIPFFFYKALDHSTNGGGVGANNRGQNAQMFFNVSSRQIKHLHLYASVFIDEISFGNMFNPAKQSNLMSFKAGLRLTNPFKAPVSLILEYTRNNPIVYRHHIPTTSFENNSYNMGHYLGDNSEEYYVGIKSRPMSRLRADVGFVYARKGPEIPYTTGADGKGLKFMESVEWKRVAVEFRTSYEFLHDGNIFVEYQYQNIKGVKKDVYTPSIFQANPHTISFGLMFGI